MGWVKNRLVPFFMDGKRKVVMGFAMMRATRTEGEREKMPYHRRKIDAFLPKWKERKHYPLLISGLPQCGKTTSVLPFAKSNCEAVDYFNGKDFLNEKENISYRIRRLFAATPFDFSDEKNDPILLLTFVSLLFPDKKVSDEVNAGKGRFDILVEGRKPNEAGFIVEIKYFKTPSSRARLEKTAEVAFAQMENKDYLEILRKDQANPILSYGIVFDPKKAVTKAKKE